MTDLYVTKAIVKLPPKGRQSILLNNNTIQPKNKYQDHLVSERLYVEVPSLINENDIIMLLQTCHPQNIDLTPNSSSSLSTGFITFPNKDSADCALTLFHGATFKNKSDLPIHLHIQPKKDGQDPEPEADILQVCDLPSSTTNQSLYELFRPFGPLALCKIIMEYGTKFNGTAMIQYYHVKDSDQAISSMNNTMVQGNAIGVFPFVSSKQNGNSIDTEPVMKVTNSTTTTTTAINSPSLTKGENTIDYTNLYIKNLDLNVKSSDLFNHFRKYGRIISARVMKNTDTKQSKGFGFVSFSTPDEALAALKEMDGQYILSKPVQVAFHEPKKSRNDPTPSKSTHDAPILSSSNGSPLLVKQQQQQQQASSPLINQYNHTPKLNTSNSTSIPLSNKSTASISFSPPLPQQSFYQQRQQHNNNHNNQQHYNNNNTNTNHNNSNNNNINYHHHQQYNNNNTNTNSNNIPSTHQQDIFNSKPYQKKQPNLSRNKSNQSLSDNIILQNGFTVEKNTRGYMDYHQQIKTNNRQIPTDNHSHHSYGISSPPLPSSLSSTYNHRSNNSNSHNNNSSSSSNHFPPSLSTLASGASIQQAPYSSLNNVSNNNNNNITNHQTKPTLRRRGSIESICSVVTESSSHAQRQKMMKAVQDHGGHVRQDQINDIVDMLLTLKKKERSLCLFNPDFLKSKIEQALDALALTMDDDDEDEENEGEDETREVQMNTTITDFRKNINHHHIQQQQRVLNTSSPITSPNLQNHYQPPPASSITYQTNNNTNGTTTSSTTALSTTALSTTTTLTNNNHHHIIGGENEINGTKRKSHAIPIVAPTSTTATTLKSNTTTKNDIDEFLATFEGLSTLEKKQKLGDKLFPLVKATGIKHAPKVTIRLLDNIVLEELAHLMHDQNKLQSKIDYVMNLS